MQTHRLSAWDIGYVILLVLSIPILVDDAFKGLWGQVALTIIFLIGGLVLLAYSWRRSETLGPSFASAREARPHQGRAHRGLERTQTGRPADWLSMAVTSGFIATGVLTSILLVAYGAASVLGSSAPNATLFAHWLWSLTHNPATNAARVNLPLALVINFGAGIVWAIIYAAIFEPRLRGSGWARGLLFALLPWLISILVVLPIANGGFLGFGFHAGPLPLLGNLILHLAYGGTLGEIYASEEVLTEDGQPASAAEARELDRSERLIALSLVPGAIVGFVLGLVGSGVFAPGVDPWLVGVFGAIIGSVFGVLIGSFAGLTPTEPVEPREPAP
ncbi:MAG TPA: hypothetical protein VFI42_14245 [Thermomicrobiaceae bacterium]|nr:hypothetical protein [Thermomicrobiaceae bacterium]